MTRVPRMTAAPITYSIVARPSFLVAKRRIDRMRDLPTLSSRGSLQISSWAMTSRAGTAVLASAECLLRLPCVLHAERHCDVAAARGEHVLGRDVHLRLAELRRDARERAGLVRHAHFDRLALRRAQTRLLQRAPSFRGVL